MRETPLLSIAIPTKNREYYCIRAIKHILSYDNHDFELVVQDNSDSDEIFHFVDSIDDVRLKYFQTKEKISSIENMSRSIGHSGGEFVCMIGDDDTILPKIFEQVQRMKANGLDSLSSRVIPSYIWPVENDSSSGVLKVIKYKKPLSKASQNTDEILSKLFSNGIVKYQKYNLPRVYHGVVRRSLMESINRKIGSYFGGLSPDIYSTVALSHLVDRHELTDLPLTIAGACPQSTTYQSSKNLHNGELSSAPHFNNNNYEWNDRIPSVYSVETIWAESGLRAAQDFSLTGLVESFDVKKLRTALFANNRNIESIVLRELNSKPSTKVSRTSLLLGSLVLRSSNFISLIFERVFIKSSDRFYNIKDISDCESKF